MATAITNDTGSRAYADYTTRIHKLTAENQGCFIAARHDPRRNDL
jgi:hypothetical protein